MFHLDKYLSFLRYQRHYSEETIRGYETDILEYLAFLDDKGKNLLKIKYDDVREYLMHLNSLKEKNSTISRKISSLRGFYKFLINESFVSDNPFKAVILPRKEKKLPKFFYYNELESLFEVPDMTTPLGQRDRLILELLYASGVRVSELGNIKIRDIGNMEVKVLGKGNKERFASFGEYAKEYLDIYLSDGYHKLNVRQSEYLFLNDKGGKLTDRGIRYILDKIIKKTALDKNISPHMLRHSFATHLLNEGCDILSVQQLLGHESLEATSIYTHVTSDRLKEVYFKTHPRAKK